MFIFPLGSASDLQSTTTLFRDFEMELQELQRLRKNVKHILKSLYSDCKINVLFTKNQTPFHLH